jgi:DNA-binding transcriptional ArsR family regulator
MRKKFTVTLTGTERDGLRKLIGAGTAPARKLTHARILLEADQSPQGPGWTDERIAEAVQVSQPTISRVRKQYVEEGLEAASNRRAPNREYHRKLDGEAEARLIALTCSEPPEGRAHRSLRLLADKVVESEIAPEVSYQTVGRILKKTNSNRGRRSNGASRRRRTRSPCTGWRMYWGCTPAPSTLATR